MVLWSGVASSKERPTKRRKLMRSLSISSAAGSDSPKHFWMNSTLSMVATGQWGRPPAAALSSLKTSATEAASSSKGISRRQVSKNARARGPPRSATVRSVNVGAALTRSIRSLPAAPCRF